ncbi:MAG: bifunctional phosphoribosylaminoimidazolecarboxamide formyltransferase/IMP cyclohydrolase [Alphaproteobacteria bacterium]|nr:bifunctional phosphoribosylaminoimidazolecarboxamide formyltransferase/IMP cyclohydrolase [Alphaproteobacteria bacterium]
MPDYPISRALISVSDKTGLLEFARVLVELKIEMISTGGTAATLRAAGFAVKDVSEVTGFPEIMDGRVKTLHPKIHGGLLNIRTNATHAAAKQQNQIGNIDLLVVNLYPFETAIAKGADWDEAIENIDVGGPAMIRAAAKNHADVTVIVDPADYPAVALELARHHGATSLATRKALAAKAFARTAAYDSAIAAWLNRELGVEAPQYISFSGRLHQSLRYGENPHQKATVYKANDGRTGITDAEQIQGKELSYNNINDADAALDMIREFAGEKASTCVIVKHANPCGVANGATAVEAYLKALACDSTSAFGGILAFNNALDGSTAEEISKLFTEIIIAPGADEDARRILTTKKNVRLLLLPSLTQKCPPAAIVKSIAGGLLVQDTDHAGDAELQLRVVSKRAPTPHELADLRFAFKVAKHVKSNAIVFAKNGATVGIGAGQMSRIDSTRIAVRKSLDAARGMGSDQALVKGAVLASDAFFPFADGIEAAAEAGATSIIQPGGAMRDEDVIRAADAAGLAMVMTGIRHFRH